MASNQSMPKEYHEKDFQFCTPHQTQSAFEIPGKTVQRIKVWR
jgi:hypothetical protein